LFLALKCDYARNDIEYNYYNYYNNYFWDFVVALMLHYKSKMVVVSKFFE